MKVVWTATCIHCIEDILAFTAHNISKDLAERYNEQLFEVEVFFKRDVKIQFKTTQSKYTSKIVHSFIHNGFSYTYFLEDDTVFFLEVYFA